MSLSDLTKLDSAADDGFGPEIFRLRPRSGCEYAFSGDAPRLVHYAIFLALSASTKRRLEWAMHPMWVALASVRQAV